MSQQVELPVDLSREIFSGILEDFRFLAWKQAHRKWQLHLSGGPGVGKTVLASLIAKHLKEESTSTTIFIPVQNYLQNGLQPSAELLLGRIHREFYQTERVNGTKTALAPVSLRTTAPRVNSSQPLQHMKEALPILSTAYLIIDDFDWLERDVQHDVEHGLNLMEEHGLRVLLTRAVPKFKSLALLSAQCDRCKSYGETGLIIYWKCQTCLKGPGALSYYLCDECNSKNSTCQAVHRMSESERYIDIDINTEASYPGLRQFAQRDLEREYSAQIKPHDIDSVVNRSEPNINLLKLRLDQVREVGSLQDTNAVSDRLPRGVIAFFDTVIERISVKNVKQRDQTLLALVALSEEDDMALDDLEQLLRDSGTFPPQFSRESHPHVHETLESARGLICIEPECNRVLIYHDDPRFYIRDGYNKDLVLAQKRLREIRSKKSDLEAPSGPVVDESAGEGVAFTAEPITSDSENFNLDATALSSYEAHVNGNFNQPKYVQSVCASCRQSFFQGKVLSGVHSWLNLDSDGSQSQQCPFCSYFRKASKTSEGATNGDATRFQWSVRTMGRTSNDRDLMSLTLRSEDQSTSHASKRFVFMPQSPNDYAKSKIRLGNSTNLCDSGAQISKWLQECGKNHAHCGLQRSHPYVPKRLIHIDAVEFGIHRIVEYPKENGITGPYVTLSHSWGGNNFLKLTTQNEEELKKGFSGSISKLGNKNFVEAIEVARFMHVKYIWIDSLCIRQGVGGDFYPEGDYMHEVYQNSFCNIVAADSRDYTGGLFRPRNPITVASVDYMAEKNESLAPGAWKILEEDLWPKQLLGSPIYTRGWVFQERMLSPRILHFTHSQVFWDCSTLSACESIPEGLPFPLEMNAATDRHWRLRLQKLGGKVNHSKLAVEDSLETFWKSAVLNYTSCDLTNQIDKTKAVWSVAKLVRDLQELENEDAHGEDEYVCGHWAKALHEQLAWYVKDVKEGSRMEVLQELFPSWSWASVSGPILLQSRLAEARCYSVKNHEDEDVRFGIFKDFKNEKSKKNEEPEFAASASLALRGYIVHGFLSEDLSARLHTFAVEKTSHVSETISFNVVLDEVPGSGSSNPSRCQFLILAASKVIKSDDGEFIDPDYIDGTDEADIELTYSGSGLILITNHEYATYFQMQGEKLRSELKHDVQRPGEQLWQTEERQRSLTQRIKACHDWLDGLNLKNQQIPSRVGFNYRRIGVVHFENISRDSWRALEAGGKTNIWLD